MTTLLAVKSNRRNLYECILVTIQNVNVLNAYYDCTLNEITELEMYKKIQRILTDTHS